MGIIEELFVLTDVPCGSVTLTTASRNCCQHAGKELGGQEGKKCKHRKLDRGTK